MQKLIKNFSLSIFLTSTLLTGMEFKKHLREISFGGNTIQVSGTADIFDSIKMVQNKNAIKFTCQGNNFEIDENGILTLTDVGKKLDGNPIFPHLNNQNKDVVDLIIDFSEPNCYHFANTRHNKEKIFCEETQTKDIDLTLTGVGAHPLFMFLENPKFYPDSMIKDETLATTSPDFKLIKYLVHDSIGTTTFRLVELPCSSSNSLDLEYPKENCDSSETVVIAPPYKVLLEDPNEYFSHFRWWQEKPFLESLKLFIKKYKSLSKTLDNEKNKKFFYPISTIDVKNNSGSGSVEIYDSISLKKIQSRISTNIEELKNLQKKIEKVMDMAKEVDGWLPDMEYQIDTRNELENKIITQIRNEKERKIFNNFDKHRKPQNPKKGRVYDAMENLTLKLINILHTPETNIFFTASIALLTLSVSLRNF